MGDGNVSLRRTGIFPCNAFVFHNDGRPLVCNLRGMAVPNADRYSMAFLRCSHMLRHCHSDPH